MADTDLLMHISIILSNKGVKRIETEDVYICFPREVIDTLQDKINKAIDNKA